MEPPEHLVQARQGAVAKRGERLGKYIANRRPQGEIRVLLQFGDGHPTPLDEKAGDQNGEKQGVNTIVVGDRFEPLRLDEESAHEEAAEHHDGDQTGKVEHKGEVSVEVPFQNSNPEKRQEEISLHHDEHRACKQGEKTPEKERMEHPSILDPEDAGLAEDSRKHTLCAVAAPIETIKRLSLAPNLQPLFEAEGRAAHCRDGEQVHDGDDPVPDVPVYFTSCIHWWHRLQ